MKNLKSFIKRIIFCSIFLAYIGCGGGGGSSSSSKKPIVDQPDPAVVYLANELKSIAIEQVLPHELSGSATPFVVEFNPLFSKDVSSYTASVRSDVEKIKIAATAAIESSKVKINGIEIGSGQWCAPFPLSKGSNTFTITILPEEGETEIDNKVYTVVITKEAQNPSTAIEDLEIIAGDSGAEIYPPFDPEIHEYYMAVPADVDTISMSDIKVPDGSTVEIIVNGEPYDGDLSEIPVEHGNNYIEIIVTDSEGNQTIYLIIVNRATEGVSNNADLASLELSGGIVFNPLFDKNIIEYNAIVNKEQASVKVKAATEDNNASITINGVSVDSAVESDEIILEYGMNTLFVEVTPEDQVLKKTYVIKIEKLNSIEIPENKSADLSNIEISGGISLTPAFDSNKYVYNAITQYETESVSIKPVPASSDALVKTEVNSVEYDEDDLSTVPLVVGNNLVKITVSGNDGLVKVYKINLNRGERIKSNVATLSNIILTCDSTSLNFSPSTLEYSFNVDYEVDQYSLSVVKGEARQSVTIGSLAEGTLATSGSLVQGDNSIIISVVSEDGNVNNTYKVNINRAGPKSNNNYLANLGVNAAGSAITFDKNIMNYDLNIHHYVSECTIIAEKDERSQQVTINGESLLEKTFTGLRVGENLINVVVTAENGEQRTYKVKINRADTENNDADLLAIDMSGINLIPVFDKNRLTYTAEVPHGLTSTDISVLLSDCEKASVKINGKDGKDQLVSENLAVGQNSITIDVTAEDPRFTKKYVVTIYRAGDNDKSNNSALSDIRLSPEEAELATLFVSNILSYSVNVPYEVDKVFVTPVRGEDAQSVSVNSTDVDFNGGISSVEIPLEVKKDNLISVVVVAEDGVASRTYQIKINRAAQGVSNNANLSGLTINDPDTELRPGFDKNLLEYMAYVDKDISSVRITPHVESGSSTVTVNGVAVNSGAASAPISLITGDNTVNVTVKAEDDTLKTYVININRAVEGFSNDATLSSLRLSSGNLRPVFDSNVFDYAVTVDSSVQSIDINAVQSVPGETAKVLVNGSADSNRVSLETGYNFVEVTSIAQDGKARLVYNLSILKPVSGLTVYFKMPISWGVANSAFVYYEYGSGENRVSSDDNKSPQMVKMGKVNEGGTTWSWWSYTIADVPEDTSVKLRFKNSPSSSAQCGTSLLTRDKKGWFVSHNDSGGSVGGNWHDSAPDGFENLFIEAVPHFEQEGRAIPFNDTKEITLLMGGDDIDICKYSLDGSDPETSLSAKSFINNMKIIIGQTMENGDTIRLKLYAKNNSGKEIAKEYLYEKTDKQYIVHFKRPASWGSADDGVVAHQWYEVDGNMWLITGWSTCPEMTYDGDGWYSYYIEGLDSAGVIFKKDNNASDSGLITADLVTTPGQSGYWFVVNGGRYSGGGNQHNRLLGDWHGSKESADSAASHSGLYNY